MNIKYNIVILVIALIGIIVLPLIGMLNTEIKNTLEQMMHAITAIITIHLIKLSINQDK